MKKLIAIVLLPVLAGCLSSSAPSVSLWPVEFTSENTPAKTPKYEVARLSQVIVRSPYNSASLCVQRKGGMLAFDPYNEFASTPSQLFKGAAQDALSRSGMFKEVVAASSSAISDVSAEITITRLSLDCREEDSRVASVEIRLMFVKSGEILSTTEGTGKANAASGDFGAAFSSAFSSAMEAAISKAR